VTTDQQDVELISQRQDGTQRSALAARDLRLQWLARAGVGFRWFARHTDGEVGAEQ